MSSGAMGTGPSTSTEIRASRSVASASNLSIALTSSALGGPACCDSADHGPAVSAVDSKRPWSICW